MLLPEIGRHILAVVGVEGGQRIEDGAEDDDDNATSMGVGPRQQEVEVVALSNSTDRESLNEWA